jgi:hypothetical protein
MGGLMVNCPTSGRDFHRGFKSKKKASSGFRRLWPSHAARTAEGTTYGGPGSPVLLTRFRIEGSKRPPGLVRMFRLPSRIFRAEFGPVANEPPRNRLQFVSPRAIGRPHFMEIPARSVRLFPTKPLKRTVPLTAALLSGLLAEVQPKEAFL